MGLSPSLCFKDTPASFVPDTERLLPSTRARQVGQASKHDNAADADGEGAHAAALADLLESGLQVAWSCDNRPALGAHASKELAAFDRPARFAAASTDTPACAAAAAADRPASGADESLADLLELQEDGFKVWLPRG